MQSNTSDTRTRASRPLAFLSVLCFPAGISLGGRGKLKSLSICALFLALVGAAAFPCNLRAQSKVDSHNLAVEFNNRGLEFFGKKDIDGAIKQFRQALAIDPNFPEALSNLGLALDAKGNDDEAIEDF